MIKITAQKQPPGLLEKVEELSGQNLFACYQCGTCSAGCPFVADMDILPEKIIRQLTFGLTDALESQTIWVCAACHLCAERCPRSIDVPKVMDALRQVWLRQRNEDYINISEIPQEVLREMPPIALVANFRKNTG
jgi:heterodisulfide reductase subunit C